MVWVGKIDAVDAGVGAGEIFINKITDEKEDQTGNCHYKHYELYINMI